eukprot:m.362118 g.362118  ORF g.362118 m.362118 type:complete len:309 (-) comp20148_c0_seq1:759-1685(-)
MEPPVKREARQEPMPSIIEGTEGMEKRVLEAIWQSKEMLTATELAKTIGISAVDLNGVCDKLSKEGKIQYEMETRGAHIVPRVKLGSSLSEKISQLTTDERLIYQIIEESGRKGIWIRDIKNKSNFEQRRTLHVIKNLKLRKLIKEVTSVVASKKKMYMLYDLEPDEDVSGGAFYDDDFDREFVEVIRRMALKHLRTKSIQHKKESPLVRYRASFASATEILNYIVSTGAITQRLTENDIKRVMETLVHDSSVLKVQSAGNIATYKIARMPAPTVAIQATVCGHCPVRRKCRPNAVVSPTSCVYFNTW